jgi:ubiquinone/menaquinone biosynthesis C-methylase UbiE
VELTQTRVGLAPLLRIEDRISVRRRRADLAVIRGLLAVKKGDRLLDVGGGTGALAAVVGGEGAKAVVLEPNSRKVTFGRSRHPQVEYHEGFAERIPFPDDSFDCAMAMLSFHHVEDPERALHEVQRVLRPSGRFLLEEFYPASAPGALARRLFGRRHGGHHRAYESEELKAALNAAGFRDPITRDGKRSYYLLVVR